ncbi:hypothetical protein Bca4012_034281 [Brassica carinata]
MEMDVESVLQFLRRNRLTEAESALRDDINEQNQLISFDFEKFLFPIPPPIRITASPLPPPDLSGNKGSDSSSDDEFFSLDSYTSESDFFIFPAPTQDKFITDNQFENNNLGVYDKSSEGSQTEASLDYLDKTFLINNLEDDSKDYIGLERECFDGELLGFSCEEDAKENDDLKTGDEVNVTDEKVNVVHDLEEDEYEVFDLRIIHWKNRYDDALKRWHELKLIGGRYYITEYIGSAAFSKVVQAHDLQNGVDVCLKIIKNDKDFFDQSLDEIKLLKHVNKHDPADEHHILRLYDYFYHQKSLSLESMEQEHLFIVCELLRANLYEFQKFNQESGGEPYFNLSRLQVLFPNEAVAMILARIVAVLGPIEMEMLEKGQETHKYFTKEFDLYHLNEERNEIEYIITEESCLEDQLNVSDELFLDFVRSLLEINPLRRPTALEALNHPWLSSSSYN